VVRRAEPPFAAAPPVNSMRGSLSVEEVRDACVGPLIRALAVQPHHDARLSRAA